MLVDFLSKNKIWYVQSGTTNSRDVSLSKFREMVEDREAWRTAVRGVAKSQTRLNNLKTIKLLGIHYILSSLRELEDESSITRSSINLFLSNFQFSSVAQSCPTLRDPMNHSTPGLPVHHQLPQFTQTHVYRVSDAIQPSHPLSSPTPPAPNPSQHQSLFQWVNSSYEMAKVLEFQLQHHSLQRNPRADLLQNGLLGSPCSPRDSQESSPTP